jgi:hypothetical protein
VKDFSTVRIYWRHFDLDKEETPDAIMRGPTTEKGFYLYSNNMMKELVYKDLEAILPYVCFRVKEKVNLGLHYMYQDLE